MIDADRAGHESYRRQSPVWQEIVSTFGEEILQPAGEVDRKRLGDIVFRDPAAREKLDSIVHPRISEIIQGEIGHLRQQGTEVVVVEAALLIEAGWAFLVDEVWVIYSPQEKVAERLRRRNNLSHEDIMSRIRSQLPFEERARYAHVVLQNVGSMDELRDEVETLWGARVKDKVS